jgi:hypothetical protein
MRPALPDSDLPRFVQEARLFFDRNPKYPLFLLGVVSRQQSFCQYEQLVDVRRGFSKRSRSDHAIALLENSCELPRVLDGLIGRRNVSLNRGTQALLCVTTNHTRMH